VVAAVRWIAFTFGAICTVAFVVLAFRAPDCLGIGVSVLRAEDCTNRETYYLLLVAGAAASAFFCIALFIGGYALELLGVIAYGRTDDDEPRPPRG
jgi:hypothetical protein